MKKGFLTKTGCVLMSSSLILGGLTFLGSSTSDAGLSDDGSTFTFTSSDNSVSSSSGYQGSSTLILVTDESSCGGTIGSYGFANCTALATVYIEGDASIGEYAFYGDTALSAVTLGSVSSASSTSFSGCSALSAISIVNDGSYFDYDGALYNGTTLIYVPAAKTSLTVKADTTAIGEGAFNDSNVSTLTFESGSVLSSFGSQSGWPLFSDSSYVLTVNATGVSDTAKSTLENYFDSYVETYGSTRCILNFDSSSSDSSGSDSSGSDSSGSDSSGSDSSGSDSSGSDSSGSDSSGSDSSSSDSSSSDSSSTGTDSTSTDTTTTTTTTTDDTKYTVTVIDKFYKADERTVIKTTTRTTATYTKGDTYSYEPASYAGFVCFGGLHQSGTVNTNRTAEFYYKETTGAAAPANPEAKYKVIEGANQTVSQNGGPVRVVCDGPMDKLLHVQVDGKDIPEGNYTLESGSVILTMTYNYIKSLSVGNHKVRFVYTDGYGETDLNITAGKTTTTVTYTVSSDGSISQGHTQDTTPTTADGFDVRYLLCAAIFLLGAAAILLSRQKNLLAIAALNEDE